MILLTMFSKQFGGADQAWQDEESDDDDEGMDGPQCAQQ